MQTFMEEHHAADYFEFETLVTSLTFQFDLVKKTRRLLSSLLKVVGHELNVRINPTSFIQPESKD